MASPHKRLDNDAPYRSCLDGAFHRLTPTPISSIVASITFDLITILYSNMSSYIDAISGDI